LSVFINYAWSVLNSAFFAGNIFQEQVPSTATLTSDMSSIFHHNKKNLHHDEKDAFPGWISNLVGNKLTGFADV